MIIMTTQEALKNLHPEFEWHVGCYKLLTDKQYINDCRKLKAILFNKYDVNLIKCSEKEPFYRYNVKRVGND